MQEGHYTVDALNSSLVLSGPGAWFSLSSVDGLQYFHPTAPNGDIVGGQMSFVVALPPIPASSGWALTVFGLLLAIAASVMLGRHPRASRLEAFCSISAAVVALGLFVPHARGQFAEIPADTVPLMIDSGIVSATGQGTTPVVIFSQTVTQLDAQWQVASTT